MLLTPVLPWLLLASATSAHAQGQASGLKTIDLQGEQFGQNAAAQAPGPAASGAPGIESLTPEQQQQMLEQLKASERSLREQREALEKLDQEIDQQGKGR